MRRIAVPVVLCFLFAFTTTGASCTGGGSSEKPVLSAAQKLAEWVGLWSDDAARAEHRPPPKLEIPRPPVVALDAAATAIADDVKSARPALADLRARVWHEGTQQATEVTQGALCEWFSWYVEDPYHRTLPDSDTFLFLFAKGGLGVILRTPVEQEIRESVELFRNAIERGQNLAEDVRNEAMAAACSLPVGLL
jgi:hypothetical protein